MKLITKLKIILLVNLVLFNNVNTAGLKLKLEKRDKNENCFKLLNPYGPAFKIHPIQLKQKKVVVQQVQQDSKSPQAQNTPAQSKVEMINELEVDMNTSISEVKDLKAEDISFEWMDVKKSYESQKNLIDSVKAFISKIEELQSNRITNIVSLIKKYDGKIEGVAKKELIRKKTRKKIIHYENEKKKLNEGIIKKFWSKYRTAHPDDSTISDNSSVDSSSFGPTSLSHGSSSLLAGSSSVFDDPSSLLTGSSSGSIPLKSTKPRRKSVSKKSQPDDGGKILVSVIEQEMQETNTFQKIIAEQSNLLKLKEDENNKTMQKILMLRLMAVKYVIMKMFDKNNKNFKLTSDKLEFKGEFKSFSVGDVQIVQGLLNESIKGHYQIENFGSGKFTSDIDFNVDFVGLSDKDRKNILAVSIFIREFNKIFEKTFGATSLQVLDVNFYAKGFDNATLLASLQGLKYEDNTKTNISMKYMSFVAANRLAGALLLYNEAYKKIDQKSRMNWRDAAEPHMKRLLNIANHHNSVKCGSYLFRLHPDSKHDDLTIKQSREEKSQELRNLASADYIYSDSQGSNPFKKLCFNLAANYWALEAYVPIAAMVDMLDLQKNKINTLESGLKKFIKKEFYNEDFLMDSIIQNFAYGITHFYDLINIQPHEARDKSAKYLARVWRLISKLSKETEYACWEAIFVKLIGKNHTKFTKPPKPTDRTKDPKSSLDAVKNTAGYILGATDDAIQEAFQDGLTCLTDFHALQIRTPEYMTKLQGFKQYKDALLTQDTSTSTSSSHK